MRFKKQPISCAKSCSASKKTIWAIRNQARRAIMLSGDFKKLYHLCIFPTSLRKNSVDSCNSRTIEIACLAVVTANNVC